MTLIIFFFFQAEDGIRDLTVTGVTCALPISYLGNRESGFLHHSMRQLIGPNLLRVRIAQERNWLMSETRERQRAIAVLSTAISFRAGSIALSLLRNCDPRGWRWLQARQVCSPATAHAL